MVKVLIFMLQERVAHKEEERTNTNIVRYIRKDSKEKEMELIIDGP